MKLNEEIVKYIFNGVESEVAPGEDGYIVYGFASVYPYQLGIFVPIDVDKSNYSDVYPKGFESYFSYLDSDLSYLSRLLEMQIDNPFANLPIQYVSGKTVKHENSDYTVFRFDELLNPDQKTEILCRISRADIGTTKEQAKIIACEPSFIAEACDRSGERYLYFITSLDSLFQNTRTLLAAAFSFAISTKKQ